MYKYFFIILFFISISNTAIATDNVSPPLTYETIRGLIIVNVEVNGVPGRFLLDTGSGGCNFSSNYFNSLNLDIVDSVTVFDAFGTQKKIPIALTKKISFNGLQVDSIAVALIEDIDWICECYKVDGILGSVIFKNTILQIDSKNNKLRFIKEIPKNYLEKYYVSDITFNSGMPFINLKISNDTCCISTVFDTGSMEFFSLSTSDFIRIKSCKIINEYATSIGSSGFSAFGPGEIDTCYIMKIPSLKINSLTLKNTTSKTVNSPSGIGVGLLKYGIATVDYANKRFFFEPYDSLRNSINKGDVIPSISLAYRDSHLRVGYIWSKKIKEKLSVGDKVISIWGRNVEYIDLCDLIRKPKSWFKLFHRVLIKVERSDGSKVRLFEKI